MTASLILGHTGHRVEIGTLDIRQFLRGWHHRIPQNVPPVMLPFDIDTCGPSNRYTSVLFLEKEGFAPLLEHAQIAERYDLAIMSTKDMPSVAARRLVDALSHREVTVFVLHDFDKSGLSILKTLRESNTRWTYTTTPRVVDLGLRLDDVQAMQLDGEEVRYGSSDPRAGLRHCWATSEEIAYLVRGRDRNGWVGARVELNAMTSPQFLDWLTTKLEAYGVRKVLPSADALHAAYRHMVLMHQLEEALDQARSDLPDPNTIALPSDLATAIRARIENTATSWDAALREYVTNQAEEE